MNKDHCNSQLLLPAISASTVERERKRVDRARYKTRKRNAADNDGRPVTLTLEEWLTLLDAFDWRCAYCYGPFETLEHVVPLGWGGGTTMTNCVPCCERCNSERNKVQTAVIEWKMSGVAEIAQDLVAMMF